MSYTPPQAMNSPQNDPYPSADPTHFPADKYLEQALLGQILIAQSLDGLDELRAEDFYFGRHSDLFAKMRQVWEEGEPLDLFLICDRDLELLALTYECMAAPEPLTPPDAYARKVRDLAQKRRMIPLWNKAAEMSLNGSGPEKIINYVQTETEKMRSELCSGNPFDRWKEQGITGGEAAAAGKIERVYLVEDIIREKSVSIFYGAPGEFKSALCMDLALCIANGVPWLSALPIEGNKQRAFATRQARVLWLNYDQGHDDIVERLGAMARTYGNGDNVTAISQSYPTATLTSETQARALGEFCRENGYRALIVDSLLDIKGKADLQEAAMGDVLRMWRIVAEVGEVAIIIIAHNTKITLDLYGSQFIKAKLDHLYYVSRPAGTDVAVIESKKQRNFGEQTKLYARWTYQHYEGTRTLEQARFWGDGTEGKAAAHPNNTTQSTILKVLMDSPGRGFTTSELGSILNQDRETDEHIEPTAVKNAARRLFDNEKLVHRTEKGQQYLYHFGEYLGETGATVTVTHLI
jgi:hypothetical protein